MSMQLGRLSSPTAGGDTIMRRLKHYLQVHRQATLGDLALHFDVPADAMRGMLQTWLRKGRVRELDVQASCNTSCATACDDSAMTIYEWVDDPTGAPSSFTSLAVIQPGAPVGGGSCCSRR
jgi:hypothetical protein